MTSRLMTVLIRMTRQSKVKYRKQGLDKENRVNSRNQVVRAIQGGALLEPVVQNRSAGAK
jgi:hypothetical protein